MAKSRDLAPGQYLVLSLVQHGLHQKLEQLDADREKFPNAYVAGMTQGLMMAVSVVQEIARGAE